MLKLWHGRFGKNRLAFSCFAALSGVTLWRSITVSRTPEQTDVRFERLNRDIDFLAFNITRAASTRDDLKQEMACLLLTLPPGQTRAWYLSRLGDHARKYWGRRIVDAPLGRNGRPIMERRTTPVGGLAELDRLAGAA